MTRLDVIWAEIIACVEAGLRGAPCPTSIDAATRDRLVVTSPRAVFAALATSVGDGPREETP